MPRRITVKLTSALEVLLGIEMQRCAALQISKARFLLAADQSDASNCKCSPIGALVRDQALGMEKAIKIMDAHDMLNS